MANWTLPIYICLALGAILSSIHQRAECQVIDVRLVNGSTEYEGNIEYTEDNNTWHTVCGGHLSINDVIVICRQLGHTGANKNIRDSPFGETTVVEPTSRLECSGEERQLSECTLGRSCSSSTTTIPEAAKCYDETYLGCYKDDRNNRVFSVETNLNGFGSIKECVEFCRADEENVFAGIEFGNECFCGSIATIYNQYGEGNDTACTFPCSGNPQENCGGQGYLAVFNISQLRLIGTPDMHTFTSPQTNDGNMSVTASMFGPEPTTRTQRDDSKSEVTSQKTTTKSQAMTQMSSPMLQASENDQSDLIVGTAGAGAVVLAIILIIVSGLSILFRHRKHQRNAPDTALTVADLDPEAERHNSAFVTFTETEEEESCAADEGLHWASDIQPLSEIIDIHTFTKPMEKGTSPNYINTAGLTTFNAGRVTIVSKDQRSSPEEPSARKTTGNYIPSEIYSTRL